MEKLIQINDIQLSTHFAFILRFVSFDFISIHLFSYLFDSFESSLVLGLSLCIVRVNGKIAEFKNIKANCTSIESFQNAKYKMNYMCIWKIPYTHIYIYIYSIYIHILLSRELIVNKLVKHSYIYT